MEKYKFGTGASAFTLKLKHPITITVHDGGSLTRANGGVKWGVYLTLKALTIHNRSKGRRHLFDFQRFLLPVKNSSLSNGPSAPPSFKN